METHAVMEGNIYLSTILEYWGSCLYLSVTIFFMTLLFYYFIFHFFTFWREILYCLLNDVM